MCVTPSGLGLSNCFCFLILYVSPLCPTVLLKRHCSTLTTVFLTSVSLSLQVLLFNTSPLLPCSRTMATEDKLTPFYTFVNKFLSNYNQNRTCKELLLGSVNGQMILTKSIKDLNWNWTNIKSSEQQNSTLQFGYFYHWFMIIGHITKVVVKHLFNLVLQLRPQSKLLQNQKYLEHVLLYPFKIPPFSCMLTPSCWSLSPRVPPTPLSGFPWRQ